MKVLLRYTIFIFGLSFFTSAFSLSAQSAETSQVFLHRNGDLAFTIGAGGVLPLFYLDNNLEKTETGLTPGFYTSLTVHRYFSRWIALGFGADGYNGKSINQNDFYMVPLTMQILFEIPLNRFSIGFSSGIGFSLLSYQEYFNIDTFLKAGMEFFWYADSRWAFGLNSHYMVDLQDTDSAEKDRIANFVNISLCARYSL